jgi:hypothetical protein
VLRKLVSSRPDAGNPKLGGSPMLAAALDRNIPAMEVLVQHGADVNNDQGSPWHNSASSDPAVYCCLSRASF